jgi:DNA-binding NtrC family response regulator
LTLKQILQTSPLSLVIVCSEKVDGFLALQSMRLGALDYLIKPVDITELVESMQRILNHQRVFCLGIEPDGESVVSETKTLSSGTTPIGSPISSTRR